MKLFSYKFNIIHLGIIIGALLIFDALLFTTIMPSPFKSNLLGFLSSFSFNSQPSCKDCNIILISVDTLGANHLPCYGYTRNTSPNLCKFAQDNILIEDMSSNSSYTLPSHVSIFTGLYPHQHKVNIPNIDKLNKEVPFLPEELKKNGYETYFCMTKIDPQLPIDKVYNRGIDKIYEDWDMCLKKLKANNRDNKKTFIFLHTYRIHSPYLVGAKNSFLSKLTTKKIPSIPETNEDFDAMKYEDGFFHFFSKKLEEDLRDGFWGSDKTTIYNYTSLLTAVKAATTQTDRYTLLNHNKYQYVIFDYLSAYYTYKSNLLPKNQVARLSDMYDVAIMELDTFLGKMLDALHKTKLWDNTVILVTSDHGEEFMEHERVVGHGANLYNTTTRIPLVMRVPNEYQRRITIPTESVDIFPTLLDIVGTTSKPTVSGLNIFNSKEQVQKADLFYNNFYVRSIRDKDWKLIVTKSKKYTRSELYNLLIDPNERNNRIFENQDKAIMLQKILNQNELRTTE